MSLGGCTSEVSKCVFGDAIALKRRYIQASRAESESEVSYR
jgi:hypothetical protein